jgi:hypothetical protein
LYLRILSAQVTKLFFTVKGDCIVGFEVLSVVTMKDTLLWDVTLYSFDRSSLTFQRNILPPSSVLKNKPSR